MTLATYLPEQLAATGRTTRPSTSWAVCVLDMQSGLRTPRAGAVQLDGDHPARPKALLAPQRLRQRRRDGVDVRLAAAQRPDLELLWSATCSATNRRPSTSWPGTTTPPTCGQFHCGTCWTLMEHNPYLNPGDDHAGPAIDLSQVKVGAYNVGGITDHIALARVLRHGAAVRPGRPLCCNAGHLQSLISHQARRPSSIRRRPGNGSPTDGCRPRGTPSGKAAGGRTGARGSRRVPARWSRRRRSWARANAPLERRRQLRARSSATAAFGGG